jgi:hypothetical protein
MRYVYLGFGFFVLFVIAVAGFRGTSFTKPPIEIFPDMDRQPKVKPQSVSNFFADGRSDRPVPPNTVHRGIGDVSQTPLARVDGGVQVVSATPVWTGDNVEYNTGRDAAGQWVRGFPMPFVINREMMMRGKDRYQIFCSACHGALGDGNGITRTYGMNAVPTYHDERIRTMANGEIFNTITHGKGLMGAYNDKLPVEDRWAVILYLRALQRAANGTVDDVPVGARKDLGL